MAFSSGTTKPLVDYPIILGMQLLPSPPSNDMYGPKDPTALPDAVLKKMFQMGNFVAKEQVHIEAQPSLFKQLMITSMVIYESR